MGKKKWLFKTKYIVNIMSNFQIDIGRDSYGNGGSSKFYVLPYEIDKSADSLKWISEKLILVELSENLFYVR